MKQRLIRQTEHWLFRRARTSGTRSYRALVFFVIIVSMPGYSAVSDEACLREFTPIIEKLDVAAMSKAFNNRPINDVCSRAMHHQIHLDFTNEVAERAQRILQNSESPERASDWLDQFASVELGLSLAKSWQVNFVRGEIATAKGDKREAAEQFEVAYARSLDTSTHMNQAVRSASMEQQEYLYLRANEARHLYGDLSGAISRSGESSVATMATRGAVQQQASPLPIEFETDSAVITQIGINNVKLIVAYIRKHDIKEFEVIGHTDWRGESDYNQKLSVKRAQAAAEAIQNQYRKSQDGALQITVQGRGEDCPRIISQLDQYSVEDAAALYRRVSLGWSRKGTSGLLECDDFGIKSEQDAKSRLSTN